jgi:hypothetical protein
MSKTVAFVFALCLPGLSRAEEAPPTATATAAQESHLAVGVAVRGTTASANLGGMAGLRLAYIADERVSLGLAGFMTFAGPIVEGSARNQRTLSFGYGGPELGFLYHTRAMDVSLRGLFGIGRIGNYGTSNDTYSGTDTFYALEPSLHAQMLFGSLKVGLGVGYRWALNVHQQGLPINKDGTTTAANGFNVDLTGEFNVL